MIPVRWLKWVGAVAVVLGILVLCIQLLRDSDRVGVISSVLVLAAVVAAVAIAVLPSLRRRALLATRHPDGFVRNVRKTGSLATTIGVAVPRRPTLVVTNEAILLFGGWSRPTMLSRTAWSQVVRLELGVARELYLRLEALRVVLDNGDTLVLPIDENMEAIGGSRLRDVAHIIGAIGGVEVVREPDPAQSSRS